VKSVRRGLANARPSPEKPSDKCLFTVDDCVLIGCVLNADTRFVRFLVDFVVKFVIQQIEPVEFKPRSASLLCRDESKSETN